MKPFTVGLVPASVLAMDMDRTYFMIVNTSGANRLFIGFDSEPTTTSGLPLEINLGAYEPDVVPVNEIYALGAGAGTTGVILYASS